jgi:hypothetical protein
LLAKYIIFLTFHQKILMLVYIRQSKGFLVIDIRFEVAMGGLRDQYGSPDG